MKKGPAAVDPNVWSDFDFLRVNVAKGYFTQGVAVLLKAPLELAQLKSYLDGFELVETREASASWQMAGPSLILEYRPELDGHIQIDLVDKPWPDSMGGMNEDPALFAAWGAGAFGPLCFPGSLARACQHCYTWKEGPELALSHRAFLRLRVTYSLDNEVASPRKPRDVRPVEECEFLLTLAEALLEHPSALCYFNPSGEILAPLPMVSQICEHYRKASAPPINLLVNRRVVKFDDSGWMMMDTVGMGQLDKIDLEVCFSSRYDVDEIATFLANTALHLSRPGSKIKDGHTVTGPQGVLFEARSFHEPLLVPPRETLRLRPRDATVSPPEVGFGDEPLGKRAWWQFWKL